MSDGGSLAPLAERLGLTEGQAYTTAIGALLALLLFATSVPPTLRSARGEGAQLVPRLVADAPAQPPAPAVGPAPESTEPLKLPMPAASRPSGALSLPPAASAARPAPSHPRMQEDLQIVTWSVARRDAILPELTEPAGPSVAIRGGMEQMRSYVRLSGRGERLALPLIDEPGANVLAELASLRLCRIGDAKWTMAEQGATFDDAPAVDVDDCVDGVGSAEGWAFDLSRWDEAQRHDARGFAIVGVVAPAATWRVTLDPGGSASQPDSGPAPVP